MNKKTIKALTSLIIAILGIIGTVYVTQPEKVEGTQVIKVVDGDTVDVSINGTEEKLRLIGINTPETVDPRKPVECFGKEASARAKELLSNKKVTLEFDPTQDKTDKYGRTLAYIFLEDGTNFNKKMIEDGYAYEYTYDKPYRYQLEFKAAQKYAEEHKKGLWADTACSTN
jgi:micrococcal nuclease